MRWHGCACRPPLLIETRNILTVACTKAVAGLWQGGDRKSIEGLQILLAVNSLNAIIRLKIDLYNDKNNSVSEICRMSQVSKARRVLPLPATIVASRSGLKSHLLDRTLGGRYPRKVCASLWLPLFSCLPMKKGGNADKQRACTSMALICCR